MLKAGIPVAVASAIILAAVITGIPSPSFPFSPSDSSVHQIFFIDPDGNILDRGSVSDQLEIMKNPGNSTVIVPLQLYAYVLAVRAASRLVPSYKQDLGDIRAIRQSTEGMISPLSIVAGLGDVRIFDIAYLPEDLKSEIAGVIEDDPQYYQHLGSIGAISSDPSIRADDSFKDVVYLSDPSPILIDLEVIESEAGEISYLQQRLLTLNYSLYSGAPRDEVEDLLDDVSLPYELSIRNISMVLTSLENRDLSGALENLSAIESNLRFVGNASAELSYILRDFGLNCSGLVEEGLLDILEIGNLIISVKENVTSYLDGAEGPTEASHAIKHASISLRSMEESLAEKEDLRRREAEILGYLEGVDWSTQSNLLSLLRHSLESSELSPLKALLRSGGGQILAGALQTLLFIQPPQPASSLEPPPDLRALAETMVDKQLEEMEAIREEIAHPTRLGDLEEGVRTLRSIAGELGELYQLSGYIHGIAYGTRLGEDARALMDWSLADLYRLNLAGQRMAAALALAQHEDSIIGFLRKSVAALVFPEAPYGGMLIVIGGEIGPILELLKDRGYNIYVIDDSSLRYDLSERYNLLILVSIAVSSLFILLAVAAISRSFTLGAISLFAVPSSYALSAKLSSIVLPRDLLNVVIGLGFSTILTLLTIVEYSDALSSGLGKREAVRSTYNWFLRDGGALILLLGLVSAIYATSGMGLLPLLSLGASLLYLTLLALPLAYAFGLGKAKIPGHRGGGPMVSLAIRFYKSKTLGIAIILVLIAPTFLLEPCYPGTLEALPAWSASYSAYHVMFRNLGPAAAYISVSSSGSSLDLSLYRFSSMALSRGQPIFPIEGRSWWELPSFSGRGGFLILGEAESESAGPLSAILRSLHPLYDFKTAMFMVSLWAIFSFFFLYYRCGLVISILTFAVFPSLMLSLFILSVLGLSAPSGSEVLASLAILTPMLIAYGRNCVRKGLSHPIDWLKAGILRAGRMYALASLSLSIPLATVLLYPSSLVLAFLTGYALNLALLPTAFAALSAILTRNP